MVTPRRAPAWMALLLPLAACSDPDDAGAPDGAPDGLAAAPDAAPAAPDAPAPLPDARPVDAAPLPDAPPQPFVRGACPPLFGQDVFPTFEIEMAPEEWAAMEAEWDSGRETGRYYPLIAFRLNALVVTDAMIRLRGNDSNWIYPKMQFQISFNETDPDGRFLGLRKVILDAAHYNRNFLRDRVAYAYLRDLGLPAPCANNARLFVNGEYYGLYENIEKVDREFLERNYEDPDGDLWKKGEQLKTNETTATTERIDRYWDTYDVAALAELVDLDQAVLEWAGEAVIPDADGYWAGGWNYYLYDVPGGRFEYLPWDIDLAFSNLPASTDPVTWHKTNENFHGRPHYDAVLADPAWFARYVEAIRRARDAYDPVKLEGWIVEWSTQIDEAALTDPNKPFSNDTYRAYVRDFRAYVHARAAFLDDWLACWENGGSDRDGDLTCDP